MPWADALYGHDLPWWKIYEKKVREVFKGALIGAAFKWRDIERHPVPMYQNSGCGAISYAVSRGATRIILIGFDCQKTGGKAHHHGDHPPSLGNAKSMSKWAPLFSKLAVDMKRRGVEVLNASRETALQCFPRIDLEMALADRDQSGSTHAVKV